MKITAKVIEPLNSINASNPENLEIGGNQNPLLTDFICPKKTNNQGRYMTNRIK